MSVKERDETEIPELIVLITPSGWRGSGLSLFFFLCENRSENKKIGRGIEVERGRAWGRDRDVRMKRK